MTTCTYVMYIVSLCCSAMLVAWLKSRTSEPTSNVKEEVCELARRIMNQEKKEQGQQ